MRRSIFSAFFLLAFGLAALPALAQRPYISAAINWTGGKAQFFLSDGTYVRYDMAADHADPGYPQPINDSTWPGLGPHGKHIVAAFNGLNNKAYFFLDNGNYLRYDIGRDSVDPGYPAPIDDRSWPGLGNYNTSINGALDWGNDTVEFFLSNHTYIRYDLRADHVEAGYPKPIDHATWPGLAPYASLITACINWTNGKAYFFLVNGTYLRYDIAGDHVDAGYPQPINHQTWPGLDPYFRH